MKLISFRIKGFKSIIDTGESKTSDKDNITVLAGQNEAGKSAALEALDFFKQGPGPDFVRLQKRMDSKITEVICKFLLSDEDLAIIKTGFNDERIDSFFHGSRKVEIRRVWTEGKNASGDLITAEDYFSPFKFDNPPPLTPIPETTTQSTTEKTAATSPSAPTETRDSLIKKFKDRILSKLPVITLYRYFSDFLPSEIEIKKIQTNAAVRDFEKVFNVNLTEIATISDSRQLEATLEDVSSKATDDFNKSWSQKLNITDDTKYKFVVRINQQEPKKISFMVKGTDNKPLWLEQKSMGFRWFSAFHLRLRALGKTENLNNLILLVDEPGQNLHEKAQLDAKKVLEELASKGAQVLYSTHNAKLIGTEGGEFARIRLVSNSKSKGTKIETVSQFAAHSDSGSMDALSPIITAMGMSSISSFVDRERFNTVVEGVTDHYYFSAFKKLFNKDDKLYFVPACGVNNVPNLVSVLMGWGFKYKAVFDDDAQGGRKAYSLLKKEFYENDDNIAHENIFKIKDCYGIEDIFSQGDFYKYVLGQTIPRGGQSQNNSELAKNRKEILARQFLEKVENNEIISFDSKTKKKIKEVFDWLYQKFGITS